MEITYTFKEEVERSLRIIANCFTELDMGDMDIDDAEFDIDEAVRDACFHHIGGKYSGVIKRFEAMTHDQLRDTTACQALLDAIDAVA